MNHEQEFKNADPEKFAPLMPYQLHSYRYAMLKYTYRVLKHFGFHRGKAQKVLGVSVRTIQANIATMKTYGWTVPDSPYFPRAGHTKNDSGVYVPDQKITDAIFDASEQIKKVGKVPGRYAGIYK